MKSTRSRAGIVAALVLLIVTVLDGCRKAKPGSTDSGVATDTVPGTSLLARSYDGYPTDGKKADLLRYLASLDFNIDFADIDSTAIVTYACKTGDQCPGNTVRFLIIAEKHAFQVNWQRALEAENNKKGYVPAVYWNIDRIAVPSLKLPANASLYQWVGATSATDYGIQLFSVTETTEVAVAASGTPTDYNFCQLGGNRTKSAAKLKPSHACEAASPTTTQTTQTKKSALMLTERFPEDLWLSCAGGCCQSSLTSVL